MNKTIVMFYNFKFKQYKVDFSTLIGAKFVSLLTGWKWIVLLYKIGAPNEGKTFTFPDNNGSIYEGKCLSVNELWREVIKREYT